MSNDWTTFLEIVRNYEYTAPEPKPAHVPKVIQEGDILCMQWGYDANNVNYFRVLKRTKTMVELGELEGKKLEGETGIYDGVYVTAGDTWKRYSLWSRQDGLLENTDGSEPIRFRRKVSKGRNGDEMVVVEASYGYAYLWNGEPQVDYNHH
jgi:hypothetical protein